MADEHDLFRMSDEQILDETEALRLAQLTALALKRIAERMNMRITYHMGGLWACVGGIISFLIAQHFLK